MRKVLLSSFFFMLMLSFLSSASQLQNNMGFESMKDIRAISNFLGDFFDIGDIEGYYLQKGAAIYAALLGDILQDVSTLDTGISTRILSDIQQVFNDYVSFWGGIRERNSDMTVRNMLAQRAKQIISSLGPTTKGLGETNPHNTVLFPCGYVNSDDGHAMQCEILQNSSTNMTFVVYNTGDGIQYHPAVISGPREIRQPLLVFQGISMKDLTNEHFLQFYLNI